MGRRNYLAMVVYDPEAIGMGGAGGGGGMQQGGQGGGGGVGGKLSLAADFMVQGEGSFGQGPMKYGPVVVPCLEYGR